MQRLWVSLSVALAAAVGCGRAPDGGAPPAEQAIALGPENVAVVAERTLQAGPELSGTLRAKRAATIRAEIGGTVTDVAADPGDPVKARQVLARIDDAALQDAVLAARSGLAAARNGLRVAESAARRARTLADAGAAAEQDAEQAEAALEAARAQLAEAQSRLASSGQQAGKTRARAPFAGVVSDRQVSGGDVVPVGAPLFTVIDPSRLEFEGAIPAALLGQVRPGAPVEFTVTGFGDREFEGRIGRVNPAVDPGTGQVRVYVDVPNEDGRLIAGLYAQGRVVAESDTTLAAPASAVDATSTPPTVMRVEDGRVRSVPVELGLRDEVAGAVGFRSGVERGDVLVLGSARGTLAEGARVRLPQPGPGTSGGGVRGSAARPPGDAGAEAEARSR